MLAPVSADNANGSAESTSPVAPNGEHAAVDPVGDSVGPTVAVAVGDTGGTTDDDAPGLVVDTGSGSPPHPASTSRATTAATRIIRTMQRP